MPGCRAKRPGAALTRGARAVGGHQPAVQRAAHRARARAHAPGGQRQAQGQLQREAVCGQPAGHRAGAGQHSARRGPHQPRRAPSPLISALILPCWSPCRRRTTRRAPTSTQPRRAPGLPRPLPVIPTLNLPCWSLCQLRITQRAPRSTPASAHARPHLSQGGMGCQGEKPCPLLVVPAVRICVRPRKWQSAHEVSCRRLSSAALRRAQLLCCMPACDVRRPGILSRTSTKPLKTRHKDSHLH